MQYHAIPGIIYNCWRSVPLPCGQYKAIFIKMFVQNFVMIVVRAAVKIVKIVNIV